MSRTSVGELKNRVELHVASNIVAVACQEKNAAEVQHQELGAVDTNSSGKGKPSALLVEPNKRYRIARRIAESESRWNLGQTSTEECF